MKPRDEPLLQSTNAESVGSEPLPPLLTRRLLLRLLPLVGAGYAFCFVDRANIAFAELNMRNDPSLNMTVTDFSVGAGIFFAGYSSMQLPALHIIQHFGAARVMAVLLIAWGTFGSAIGAITSLGQLYLLRFLLGVAEAGYYPGALFFLSNWLPDELTGTAAAVFTMIGGPGS